jgi:hypothetical protein
VATVEDAIEALTNPDCVAGGGRLHQYRSGAVVLMSGTDVVNRLRITYGAPDEANARVLIADALPKVQGRAVQQELPGGMRPGGPHPHVEIDYEIPADKLREQA